MPPVLSLIQAPATSPGMVIDCTVGGVESTMLSVSATVLVLNGVVPPVVGIVTVRQVISVPRERWPITPVGRVMLVLHPDLIHPVTKDELLAEVAREYKTDPEQIAWALYADLTENHILTRFDAPTPEWLLQRYNTNVDLKSARPGTELRTPKVVGKVS
jgi:hypothetical protein